MTTYENEILIHDLSNCVVILTTMLIYKPLTDEEKDRMKYVTKTLDNCNQILERNDTTQ